MLRGELLRLRPGLRGINGPVTLSNAMHLSTWTDDLGSRLRSTRKQYLRLLQQRIATSVDKETTSRTLDASGFLVTPEKRTMLKIAIVGTGNISHNHIQSYLQLRPALHHRGAGGHLPGESAREKARYGLNDARIYESHQQMLAAEADIDIVDVARRPTSTPKSASTP